MVPTSSVADYVLNRLQQWEGGTVFGYPGDVIEQGVKKTKLQESLPHPRG
jgi:hypothetical protein